MSREGGLAVFGRFFALPRDTKQQLAFTCKPPPRDPARRQHAEQALVDGEAVASTAGGGMKIDLSRDRLITVRFRSDS